jgi:hypothetical protein
VPYLAGFVTPQDYGAVGNGTTDDTVALQSAVNSGSPVFLPPATYLISSAIALPTTPFIFGAGSGTYNVTAGANLSIIKLANGANSSMFTIAAGNGAGVIRDIQLNGNKANQTGGGSAILWSSAGSAQESQWHCERVYVHDAFSSGFETQTNRQNNKFTECVSYNNGGHGINCSASDSAVINCTIGLNTLDGVLANYVCHISGCDIFSNRNGINIPSSVFGVEITNCGIDRNQQQGIYIAGSSVDVVACTIHSNGQAANNTYGSITVDDTFGTVTGVTISHCNFWLDAGITNLPSYHVNFNTATSLAQVSACSFQAASFATGTVSNNNQAVQTTVKNVLVGGTAALGDNGVGELQVANATTKPSSPPSGGTVVFSQTASAIPLMGYTPNGNKASLIDAFFQLASSPTFTLAAQTATTVTLAVESSATYLMEAGLIFTNTTGNTTPSWTGPASATMQWNSTNTPLTYSSTIGAVNNTFTSNAATNMAFFKGILIVAGTSGSLTLTLGVSAGTTTLAAGSWLRLTRLK